MYTRKQNKAKKKTKQNKKENKKQKTKNLKIQTNKTNEYKTK